MNNAQTLESVIGLIKKFYAPGQPPEEVAAIDQHLKKLQNSPEGWQLANALIGVPGDFVEVRFFGALTFTIKLNNGDWQSLDEANREMLGRTILKWTASLAIDGDFRSARKLTTALALYYLYTKNGLEECVNRLAYFLFNPTDEISDPPEGWKIEAQLGGFRTEDGRGRLEILIQFIQSLAEQYGSITLGYEPAVALRLLNSVTENLDDILSVFNFVLAGSNGLESDVNNLLVLGNSAMEALSRWILLDSLTMIDDLRRTFRLGLEWCHRSNSDDSVDFVVDVLRELRSFVDAPAREMILKLLIGPWGQESVQQMQETGGIDGTMVSLINAYYDAYLSNILDKLSKGQDVELARQLFDLIASLLHCPGYPGIDDEVLPATLEFWNTFLDSLEDYPPEDSSPVFNQFSKYYVTNLVRQVGIRLRAPTDAEWQGLIDDEKRGFKDFRVECRDTLQSAYRLLGTEMVVDYAQSCSKSIPSQNWSEIESSLFCLSTLDLASARINDSILISNIFDADLLTLLANKDLDIPQRTRQTSLRFVAQYTAFFTRNQHYLPAALNFMFSMLKDSAVATDASTSIFRVCSQCRESLKGELNSFFQQYEEFLTWDTARQFTIEKVSGAIAAILQTLSSPNDVLQGLERLLGTVDRGLSTAESHLKDTNYREALNAATISMHCLSSIAKGMSAPEDEPLEVDADDTPQSGQEYNTFRQRVLMLIAHALQMFPMEGEVVDEACNVFKAGFTEHPSAPFHLPHGSVVEFFCSCQLETPRLESVCSMLCAFFRSQAQLRRSITAKEAFERSVGAILQHLCGLIKALGDPRNDPEIATLFVDVLTRFFPHYVDILTGLQPVSDLEVVFQFTLACIQIPEHLPKRSGTAFWGTFLDLDEGTTGIPQAHLDEVLVHFGPSLCVVLVKQILGGAKRSDLEFFVPPIKLLMRRHPKAKGWMEAALLDGVPEDDTAERAARMKLLQQLGMLTNNAKIRDLLTMTWAAKAGVPTFFKPGSTWASSSSLR